MTLRAVTAFSTRRLRVSAVFASSMGTMKPFFWLAVSPAKNSLAADSDASALARSAGTASSAGATDNSMDTRRASPAAAPMSFRFSALTGILKAPRIEPIVVVKERPFIVTRTDGRFPAPISSTILGGTVIPVAVLPSRSSVALKSMQNLYQTRRCD
jgi:hypothetical protein